jgi:hypothetical protein
MAKLGHHDAERVRTVAGNLALLLWKDIVAHPARKRCQANVKQLRRSRMNC